MQEDSKHEGMAGLTVCQLGIIHKPVNVSAVNLRLRRHTPAAANTNLMTTICSCIVPGVVPKDLTGRYVNEDIHESLHGLCIELQQQSMEGEMHG